MTWWLKLAASAIVLALGASLFFAWRDSNRQQATLQAELKTTQQALADATARQASRDAAVSALVTQLQRQKAQVKTPSQVIAALPRVLPLPQPVALDAPNIPPAPAAPGGQHPPAAKSGAPDNPKPAALPAADLKPLYDFAVDCQTCQAQLATAQADLKDEQAKEQALSRERDDALRAAKGGNVFRRMARAAKWFLIGAAAGAVAAKAAH